jgi:hypothetical protein
MTFHNLALSTQMNRYISAVVDPFGASEPATIPDTMNDNSLCLRDNYESGSLTNVFDGTIQGALFWVSFGYTSLQNQAGTSTTVSYSLCAIGVDTNSNAIMLASGKYQQYPLLNYSTINGSATVDLSASLVSAMRLISVGLKILPLIEYVTDPTQIYLSYIIGGQPSANDILQAIGGGVNIEQLIKNTKGAQVYPNNEGCCTRYDPFQADHQNDMKPLSQQVNASNNWDGIKVPAIFVKFSNSVTASTALPLIITCQFWLEGVLRQPSPIYSEESESDPQFPLMKSIMSHPCDDHPYVTKGHTFKKFNPNSRGFLKTLAYAFRASSYIPGLPSGVPQVLRSVAKGVNRRRKRRRRRYRAPRNRRMRGIGVNNPPRVLPKVKNTSELPQRKRVRRSRR